MFGTTIDFTPANDSTVDFHGSRPSKADCLAIGWGYYTAVEQGDNKTLDQMLETHGGVLVRRSLRVFGNHAKRDGQKAVGQFAETLAAEIALVDDNNEQVAV